MALPESNRKAIIYALEKLQLKLNSLENKKVDKVIQFGCEATYNDPEIFKKIKETEDQCAYLSQQIKRIYKKLDAAEEERWDLKEKIGSIQQSQTQSCSNINMLQELHENDLKTTQSQPVQLNKKFTGEKSNQFEFFSKAIKCGAVSLERCASPIFLNKQKSDMEDINHNSLHSTLHTNGSHPSNDLFYNDLPVRENNRKYMRSKENKYQFDFTNMPFTVGKSVNRSHSLMANFQEVLSLMKQRHKILSNCNSYKSINTQHESLSNILQQQQQYHPSQHLKQSLALQPQCMKCGSSSITSKVKGDLETLPRYKTVDYKPKFNGDRNCDCIRSYHGPQRSQRIRSRSAASFRLLKNIQKMQDVLKTEDIVWVP